MIETSQTAQPVRCQFKEPHNNNERLGSMTLSVVVDYSLHERIIDMPTGSWPSCQLTPLKNAISNTQMNFEATIFFG